MLVPDRSGVAATVNGPHLLHDGSGYVNSGVALADSSKPELVHRPACRRNLESPQFDADVNGLLRGSVDGLPGTK